MCSNLVKYLLFIISVILFNPCIVLSDMGTDCNKDHSPHERLDLVRSIVPLLDRNKYKGDAGKIGIIGGSVDYTGSPYFVAMAALRVGADVVVIITTEKAAPLIKVYSPELIVLPYLDKRSTNRIGEIVKRMDVLIIGPGLGNDDSSLQLTYEIIILCRYLRKALIIDSEGLFLISKNVTTVVNYPPPGVILLPNQFEAEKLGDAMDKAGILGYDSLGPFTHTLLKGRTDQFMSSNSNLQWSMNEGGSGRRVGGQGDILAGILGTLYNWAIKSKLCDDMDKKHSMAASVAAYGAAKLTRSCNEKAFKYQGRAMIATDMINEINSVFKDNLELFVNLYVQ